MAAQKKGFSPQELRLMIGFGFFMELLLAYLLLVDAPIARMAKLQTQLSKTRLTYETLRSAAVAQSSRAEKVDIKDLPEPLTLGASDSPNLLIHRYLDEQLTETGATLLQVSVRSVVTEAAVNSASYQAALSMSGSYEAVQDFLKHMEHPKYLLSLNSCNVQLGEEGNLRANMDLSFYTTQSLEQRAAPIPLVK